jgi:uncharacterized membrane protein
MTNDTQKTTRQGSASAHPFRRAILRGLAVLCPPLFTVLIVLWVVDTTKSYFLEPVTALARDGLAWGLADVREDLPAPSPATGTTFYDGSEYRRLPNGEFIPETVYRAVQGAPREALSATATGAEFYRRYVVLRYLQPQFAIPFFLAVFILFLYFLGKFMAARIGVFFVGLFETLVLRLPGVRAVYRAVKQVTDYVFTERDIQVTRIVAVEYPRKGIWSMGFVTGESLPIIRDAAGEPVLAVMIPYSPVPVTGCTITVRRSECIDLNITFDQACQFIVSCGVVVPPAQLAKMRTGG